MGIPFKICGLTRPQDVEACCRAGAALCGFVTEYPQPVPWNLTRAQCGALLPLVRPPAKSCLVTGGGREQVLALAAALRPRLVQLQYRETLADTAALCRALAPLGIGVLQALPPTPGARRELLGSPEPEACAKALCQAGVWGILVDARQPGLGAAAGGAADPGLYRRVRAASSRPVLLAGGIRPENCAQLAALARPDGVDVMTGVEDAPGIKSPRKIQALAAALAAL